MRTWTAEQLRTFLGFVADDPLAALWRLYAVTGMRRGEALGLRWQDVDLDKGRLTITQTVIDDSHGRPSISKPKTPGSRPTIDLDATTVAALRAHRKAQLAERMALGLGRVESDLIFCLRTGSPVAPYRITHRFAALVKRSGLPRIRLHDLRHTAASLMLQAGVPVKVVSERLGLANAATTLIIYAHAAPGLGRAASEQLAAMIDGAR